MSDNVILAIQVGGFAVAVAALPFMSGAAQAVFAVALGVHVLGDVLRLRKDGLL